MFRSLPSAAGVLCFAVVFLKITLSDNLLNFEFKLLNLTIAMDVHRDTQIQDESWKKTFSKKEFQRAKKRCTSLAHETLKTITKHRSAITEFIHILRWIKWGKRSLFENTLRAITGGTDQRKNVYCHGIILRYCVAEGLTATWRGKAFNEDTLLYQQWGSSRWEHEGRWRDIESIRQRNYPRRQQNFSQTLS